MAVKSLLDYISYGEIQMNTFKLHYSLFSCLDRYYLVCRQYQITAAAESTINTLINLTTLVASNTDLSLFVHPKGNA
jgi:hypothetical protein